jgi:hypothetical protein
VVKVSAGKTREYAFLQHPGEHVGVNHWNTVLDLGSVATAGPVSSGSGTQTLKDWFIGPRQKGSVARSLTQV